MFEVPTKEELYKGLDPTTTMRILVVRKGAIGDVLMATPVLSTLATGYGEAGTTVIVDFYGRAHAHDVLKNNPHVDKIYEYDLFMSPSEQEENKEREKELYSLYDGVIQLHMTIEGKYLWRSDGRYGLRAIKADSDAAWGESPTRRKIAKNRDYTDATLAAAGLEFAAEKRPELYPTDEEREHLTKFTRANKEKFVVMWQVMGSTGNKAVLPAMSYMKHMIENCPEAEHYIIGDSRLTESPEIADYPQIHFTVGKWDLRQVLIMTRAADLVIGPESMLVTASSAWDGEKKTPTGKMMFFSHSMPYNISKYWKDIDNIEPSTSCHPCYLIPVTHYFEQCLTEYEGTSMFRCVATLPHEQIKERLVQRYEEWAQLHLKQKIN